MNLLNIVSIKSFATFAVSALSLSLTVGGCAASSEDGSISEVEAEEAEQGLSQYVQPGPCVVGTVKTNRKILALNCVDWAFRQESTPGNSFDWVGMSTLSVCANKYSNGVRGSREACQRVALPKQADLTCVQASPAMYSVRIR